MTANEIRQHFLDFYKTKQHIIVQSAPIVVKNDPTLLFTNAGMNQFKDYFLGNKTAPSKRIADIEQERQAMLDANRQIDGDKKQAAQDELRAAQKEFEDAKAAAGKLRNKKAGAPDGGIAQGLIETATLGTFSVAAVGKQNVGGIASLQKTSEEQLDQMKKIADNTDPNNGLAFA
jgi:hypothetical protein